MADTLSREEQLELLKIARETIIAHVHRNPRPNAGSSHQGAQTEKRLFRDHQAG